MGSNDSHGALGEIIVRHRHKLSVARLQATGSEEFRLSVKSHWKETYQLGFPVRLAVLLELVKGRKRGLPAAAKFLPQYLESDHAIRIG